MRAAFLIFHSSEDFEHISVMFIVIFQNLRFLEFMTGVYIGDIQKKQVRKIITKHNQTLYAVSLSVCRALSSDGFATIVLGDDHIKFFNNKYILDFADDPVRVFKIRNQVGFLTTAELLMSEVSKSHEDAKEERKREQEALRLLELNAKFHDTKYYGVYTIKDKDEKIIKSYDKEEKVNDSIKKVLFGLLDQELFREVLQRGHKSYDIILSQEKGVLSIEKIGFKKNAFAGKNGKPEFYEGERKKDVYYVRNDRRMKITTWDWSELIEDVRLHQVLNDDILNEERSPEDWEEAKKMAELGLKNKRYDIRSLTKQKREDLNDIYGPENTQNEDPYSEEQTGFRFLSELESRISPLINNSFVRDESR